jgi:hypothetical protein
MALQYDSFKHVGSCEGPANQNDLGCVKPADVTQLYIRDAERDRADGVRHFEHLGGTKSNSGS